MEKSTQKARKMKNKSTYVNCKCLIMRVEDRIRTGDLLNHNQAF